MKSLIIGGLAITGIFVKYGSNAGSDEVIVKAGYGTPMKS